MDFGVWRCVCEGGRGWDERLWSALWGSERGRKEMDDDGSSDVWELRSGVDGAGMGNGERVLLWW